MTKSTKQRVATPEASTIDPEVIRFRSHFEERSSLDEIVREGAQRMLQSAIEEEVTRYIEVLRSMSFPSSTISTANGRND